MLAPPLYAEIPWMPCSQASRSRRRLRLQPSAIPCGTLDPKLKGRAEGKAEEEFSSGTDGVPFAGDRSKGYGSRAFKRDLEPTGGAP
jgi:hypothetical protein